jgi:sulfate transport system ATP-binding protein
MSIELQGIVKQFGQFTAIDKLDLQITKGKLTALLGPSGSGKTTLLRLIAGLEYADQGQILFAGHDISDKHVSERGVGFVFQHYALFKHMTVYENVAFGLSVRPKKTRPSPEAIRKKVYELLSLVQLEWTADRYPSQLSGGQRQRIALARALAVEPQVLLLDEPFGALDAKVRAELRRWLRKLHDEIPITSVFVTHDQEEALEVADHIVVMNKGRIEQQGTPEHVYEYPANPFVYEFLGTVNLFHARTTSPAADIPSSTARDIATDGNTNQPAASQGLAYVRPHDIDVLHSAHDDAVAATLDLIQVVGPAVRLELRSDSASDVVQVELSKEKFRQLGLAVGQQVWLKPTYSRVFLGEGI